MTAHEEALEHARALNEADTRERLRLSREREQKEKAKKAMTRGSK